MTVSAFASQVNAKETPMLPTTTTTSPVIAPPVDKDLAEQARPGHGIPSQDPESAAQTPITASESEREAGSVLTGGGMVAGAAAGAAVGAALAGPVGVLVGGTVGVVAGALGGAAAGSLVKPADTATVIPTSETRDDTHARDTERDDLSP
ncbi:hypothetical protein GCM10011496_16410 [Polaromonas eurypsychrophila]|uniref:Bacteriocin n=2 Tax=Polaromonas eurypsychrophila TaxID=1614635 RepID=A0A916SEA1_9BURK|nr:hypothetical protein GCM10011496_16410 [Polaromonas eurypsychrophila]